MPADRLSIVLPSAQRVDFVERLLRYYRAQGLKERLLIADSSEPDEQERLKALVSGYADGLRVDLKTYPADTYFIDKLRDALAAVDTELVAVTADDDFLTLSGLRGAADFLSGHSDFSIAHGRALIFEVYPGPVYGDNVWTSDYGQHSIEQPSAAVRLEDHMLHYSTTWYSLQRTTQIRENFRHVAELRMELNSFAELLPSCLSVIRGKARRLDGLYMVRQAHRNRPARIASAFDWIIDPDWAACYRRFETCLVEALLQEDTISQSDATALVRRVIGRYTAEYLREDSRRHYEQPKGPGLKERLAQRFPALPGRWQQARALMGGRANEVLLPALLKSSSPYHADFMPIYRTIAGGNGS